MKNLFVPYHIAVMAKEKGFNEKCFAIYYFRYGINIYELEIQNKLIEQKDLDADCDEFLAPLYQQIVDWFSEKHNKTVFWCTDKSELNKRIEEAFKLI